MVEQPLFLLQCKEALASTSQDLESLPIGVQDILKEFDDIFFFKKVPHGLPLLRELNIFFFPRTNLPNRLAYKTNPQETKEIET